MTTTTPRGTAPRPGATGARPFTTVIAGSMTGPKIPEGIGDSWTHAGPEYPVTTVTIAALDPKLPPFRGDSWHPAVSMVTRYAEGPWSPPGR
jgi:hypothetical protein